MHAIEIINREIPRTAGIYLYKTLDEDEVRVIAVYKTQIGAAEHVSRLEERGISANIIVVTEYIKTIYNPSPWMRMM